MAQRDARTPAATRGWQLGLLAGALGALVAAAGCEDGVDTTQAGQQGDGGGEAALTPAQACAALEATRCAQLHACTDGFAPVQRHGDLATCEARGALACLELLTAPGTSATVESLAVCGEALDALTCNEFVAGGLPDVCAPQPGALGIGGACVTGAQCESAYCLLPTELACGWCAAPPVAGDPCVATAECGRDLVCMKSGFCVAPVRDVGAACSKSSPCAAHLACVTVGAETTGTCQEAMAREGDACDPSSIDAPDCDRSLGLICLPKGKQCVKATLVGAGETCGLLGGGAIALCAAAGFCEGATATTTGVCVAHADDGAACDDHAGPLCLPPARCADGTCKLPDASACL